MNTITIEPKLYNMATSFAKRHNTNLRTMIESYIRKTLSMEKTPFVMKSEEELSPEIRSLIGIVPANEADYNDLNGEKYKTEALKMKIQEQ